MFALVFSLSVDKDLPSAGLPHTPSVDVWTCVINATCDNLQQGWEVEEVLLHFDCFEVLDGVELRAIQKKNVG